MLTKWGDRILVGGRKSGAALVGDRGPKTTLYWLNQDEQSPDKMLAEIAELPSEGDNSYTGFIELSPTRGVISWYSSHIKNDAGEAYTAIFMADLNIKGSE